MNVHHVTLHSQKLQLRPIKLKEYFLWDLHNAISKQGKNYVPKSGPMFKFISNSRALVLLGLCLLCIVCWKLQFIFILLHASYNISWSVVGGMYIINNIIFAYFTLQQIKGLFKETLASFCSYGTTLSSSLQVLHFPWTASKLRKHVWWSKGSLPNSFAWENVATAITKTQVK